MQVSARAVARAAIAATAPSKSCNLYFQFKNNLFVVAVNPKVLKTRTGVGFAAPGGQPSGFRNRYSRGNGAFRINETICTRVRVFHPEIPGGLELCKGREAPPATFHPRALFHVVLHV